MGLQRPFKRLIITENFVSKQNKIKKQTTPSPPQKNLFLKNNNKRQVMVEHFLNPSSQEAEAGGSLILRPSWATNQLVSRQLGYCREILSLKKKKAKLILIIPGGPHVTIQCHS